MTKKSLEKRIKKLEKALKFYAKEKNWKKQVRWSGGGISFGGEVDGRTPYECFPIIEDDNGSRARRALK